MKLTTNSPGSTMRTVLSLAPFLAMVCLGVGVGLLVAVVLLAFILGSKTSVSSPGTRAALFTQAAIFAFCCALLTAVTLVEPPIELRVDPRALESVATALQKSIRTRDQLKMLNALRTAERMEPVFQSVLTEHRPIEFVESTLGRGLRGMLNYRGHGAANAENNRVNYAGWLMTFINAQKRMAIEMLDRRDLPYIDGTTTITKLENLGIVQSQIDRVQAMVDESRRAYEATRQDVRSAPVGFEVARKLGFL